MPFIAQLLAAPVVKHLIGKVTEEGIGKISKAKIGVNAAFAGASPCLPDLLAQAQAGDTLALLQGVAIVGGWALALWGRGNKAK